ncbi:CaiB/BaiF CoA transferase family protein [Rhodococcoides fascians]|uniref:CaiB/BaiF CoA transferase family protein n=1 Tax=Rhodococcoides fascians TaxID=1828 RepID=UPI00050BDE49|nr:CoA transferase [Rhodococcus fascians]
MSTANAKTSQVADALDGVRVLDFTQALSGPYCTMMLADLGADVIKIERPGLGDDARHWGPPFIGGDAAYFMSVNRNKRSTEFDLKNANHIATILDLVKTADVVVENWRPGTAERLGLGPDTLLEVNPRLVFCSISGFGQDQGTRSGYDQIVQGTSGVMSMTGPKGSPTKWGVPVGDISAGMFAATAIIAALHERHRTERGKVIDIAMQDCLISMLTHQATRYLTTDVLPPNDGNGHSTIAPYGLFETSDGFVNICVGNDSQFVRFCAGLGFDDLGADERYRTNPLRLAHRDDLLPDLEKRLTSITTAEVIDKLEACGVPVGPVRNFEQVFDNPEVAERDMLVTVEREGTEPFRLPNGPWRFDGRSAIPRAAPPRLGEHTDEVLAELDADRTAASHAPVA